MMDSTAESDYSYKPKKAATFQVDSIEHGFDFAKGRCESIDLSLYDNIEEFYREPMAPSTVSIGDLSSSDQKVIIKKIHKDCLMNDFQRKQAAQEFPLHCSLHHDNIVRGIEWSETDTEYIMTMEWINKAEYFEDKIDKNLTPIKSESKMKSYMTDALEALKYLHARGIVHGDIKLPNLLVQVDDEMGVPCVKLTDFGLSRVLDKTTKKFHMEYPVGSMSYMAPEITSHADVDEKIDIWALGICLYKMAVAYKPTQISGYKYQNGPIPFREQDWKKRSPELKDLIVKMLEMDPAKRISAEEALKHPWFQLD